MPHFCLLYFNNARDKPLVRDSPEHLTALISANFRNSFGAFCLRYEQPFGSNLLFEQSSQMKLTYVCMLVFVLTLVLVQMKPYIDVLALLECRRCQE